MNTTRQDLLAYPDFATEMRNAGGFSWKAYPVTTGSGYKLVLFRIVGDELGNDLLETRGPIMLMHGMFSDTDDWLARTDESVPPMAV